ncbi:heterokaryon incompatibility protein-domain-containing protein [Xylariomycetidae sp. FL2044]|nr:heterokaryon incompatibility protein-domain-containing protein [Xylariomycetidae sp. FL2044]
MAPLLLTSNNHTSSIIGDAESNLCPVCAGISADIFDWTALHSGEPREWTKYIRKVGTFTLGSLQPGDECDLCSYLRDFISAGLTADFSFMKAFRWLNIPPQPDTIRDGDGYTLAATLSRFVHRLPETHMAPYADSPAASILLFVVKGVDTLERLAQGEISHVHSVLPHMLRGIERDSAFISQVTEEPFNHGALFRTLQVRPQSIYTPLLQQWMAYCRSSHGAVCEPPKKGPIVPHMKLVDCETRKLVSMAPGLSYVALSYVWGVLPVEKCKYPDLPPDLPQTISDAMAVTRDVNMRYLWVDRYCIWQDDPNADPSQNHKMGQILHMDQIYHEAEFVIVAAAGTDPSYGLPGIGKTSRARDSALAARVGDRSLVASFVGRRNKHAMEKAAWGTRAWTFQEMALSRRMLIFTDYEVSFRCTYANCVEHLSHPLSLWMERFPGVVGGVGRNAIQRDEGVFDLISAYSQRRMTDPRDALYAIAGVLKAWSKANANCYHYWGVPVLLTKKPEDATEGMCSAALKKQSAIDLEVKVWDQEQEQEQEQGGGGAWVAWRDFIIRGGLRRAPAQWDQRLSLHGWVLTVGPFCARTIDGRQRGTTFYAPEREDATGDLIHDEGLELFPDLGLASPKSLTTRTWSAFSPYDLRAEGVALALVFEPLADGNVVRRVGLLLLRVCRWDHNKSRICDLSRPHFNARREWVTFA